MYTKHHTGPGPYFYETGKTMSTNTAKFKIPFVKIGLAALIFILFSSSPSAFAQGRGGQDMAERMKAQVDEVVKALALTGEKEVQVKGILEEEAKERATIFEGFQGQDRNARSMMREEMTALGERTKEKLKAVLSEEEMVRYEKIQTDIQERRRSQSGGGRGGQGGGRPPIN